LAGVPAQAMTGCALFTLCLTMIRSWIKVKNGCDSQINMGQLIILLYGQVTITHQ
jgi:hypothetical protein